MKRKRLDVVSKKILTHILSLISFSSNLSRPMRQRSILFRVAAFPTLETRQGRMVEEIDLRTSFARDTLGLELLVRLGIT
jgi:hypothetical protein